eukprot:TRINITY_DN3250_c0_g1_i1.p1 TRINITY_DN3250_c0_g1~~TRINITY_DN3250_c0_g1_i1.p1  ORF type:complete len:158 (-),score=45.68 TRINITY_DN3250_c0_g1_i1:34-507(-)
MGDASDEEKKQSKRSKKEQSESSLSEGSSGSDTKGGSKDDKRSIRLKKNRQAAQNFRKRQKVYLQDLESKVSNLNAENAEHKAKAELLVSENHMIKEQLNYLRLFVSQVVGSSISANKESLSLLPNITATELHARLQAAVLDPSSLLHSLQSDQTKK